MNPEQAIRAQILKDLSNGKPRQKITKRNVDTLWEELHQDVQYEQLEEFRGSGEETGLPTNVVSRNYECKHLARVLDDGTCVGWIYWFGGGKHGDPSSLDWMTNAEFLHYNTEERLVEVTTFSREPLERSGITKIHREEWVKDIIELLERVQDISSTSEISAPLIKIEENDEVYKAPSLVIHGEKERKVVPIGTDIIGLFEDSSGEMKKSIGRVDFLCGPKRFSLYRFSEGPKWIWLDSKEDLNDVNLKNVLENLLC